MRDMKLRDVLGFDKNCFHKTVGSGDLITINCRIRYLEVVVDLLLKELGYSFQNYCSETLPKLNKIDKTEQVNK